MTGKVQRMVPVAEVSTGGSLISDARLQQLYTSMVHCRLLTEHAEGIRKRNGFIQPYSASKGQEALATGWVIDLRPEDSLALAANDSIAALIKGIGLDEAVAQLYPLPSGANGASASHSNGAGHNILAATTPAVEQITYMLEAAQANKRKKKGNVVVAFTRDTVTGLGAWDHALKSAAKRSLPIVFVVENNPWQANQATITGSKVLRESPEFTEIARTYGLPGITVDGNDVVAVYRVAHESLVRVREGGGPVLVEGKTYHESSPAAAKRAAERDPLTHMERYLLAKKLFTPQWKEQLVFEFSRELDAAVKTARKAVRQSAR
jgi:TPP-dependent pyruvate/acetoin dehydrogenase alpha subunit